MKAHEQGHANGHIGIAREISIDLQAVTVDRHEVFKTRVGIGFGEYTINEVDGEVIG